jgi:hypothetical protein
VKVREGDMTTSRKERIISVVGEKVVSEYVEVISTAGNPLAQSDTRVR